MTFDTNEVRAWLDRLDLSVGLTRDQLRERIPTLPEEVYLHLPAAKKFYSTDEVLDQTGENALARAEGTAAGPELDLPTGGMEDDGGPVAYGTSLSPGDHIVEGAADFPGPADDLGGNSLETRAGRGIPDENQ